MKNLLRRALDVIKSLISEALTLKINAVTRLIIAVALLLFAVSYCSSVHIDSGQGDRLKRLEDLHIEDIE